MHNTITGQDDHLLVHLCDSISKATSIRIIVAFLMESGAKLISGALAEAAGRGVPIRILTGTYMSVTEPPAVYHLLHKLGDGADIRFFNDPVRSFHPKAYIIDRDGDGDLFIGSSNISRPALTDGVEWNYRLRRSLAPDDYRKYVETFDLLFAGHAEPVTEESLKAYALSWRKPLQARVESSQEPVPAGPEPRGAQVEALYYLERARAEGVGKGLVAAATGVGKTYLAAFDSLDFRWVLFVAHREEILR